MTSLQFAHHGFITWNVSCNDDHVQLRSLKTFTKTVTPHAVTLTFLLLFFLISQAISFVHIPVCRVDIFFSFTVFSIIVIFISILDTTPHLLFLVLHSRHLTHMYLQIATLVANSIHFVSILLVFQYLFTFSLLSFK